MAKNKRMNKTTNCGSKNTTDTCSNNTENSTKDCK